VAASAPPGPLPLAGRRILLTRPERESQALAARIVEAGGEALIFPTIEIVTVAPTAETEAALRALSQCQLAVFVSTNAVRHGMAQVRAAGGWPGVLPAAAVGQATADLLRAQGVREVLVPANGGDSEALLALPRLQQVAGWRVVVFRGVGGRELLAQTLARRGALVTYVECYRRALPASDPGPVCAALDAHALDAVVAASAESVRNLLALVGDPHAAAVRRLPLIVAHANIAQAARALGFEQVHLAGDAHEGVLDCLRGLLAS
jgi:uroporphyrinogen-III synthase